MLKTLALTLTLLLSFTVAACSSTSGTNAKIDQTTANAALRPLQQTQSNASG